MCWTLFFRNLFCFKLGGNLLLPIGGALHGIVCRTTRLNTAFLQINALTHTSIRFIAFRQNIISFFESKAREFRIAIQDGDKWDTCSEATQKRRTHTKNVSASFIVVFG